MKKYFRLFEALKKIYGSKFLSDLFGKKKTNIIKLPSKQSKDFVKKELNIAEAGDKAVELGKKDLAELILDIKQIEKLNDQELLTLTNNAERMAQRTNPESFKSAPADIIDMKTQETVPPEGIASLAEERGIPSDVDPRSPLGSVMRRVKQMQLEGKNLADEFGMTDDLKKGLKGLSDPIPPQIQKEGLVKATANDIMIADMKSGKFPATKEMQQEILEGSSKSLDYFRRFYGEDALEVLDSLIPDLAKMRTSKEAADFAKKQYNFEAKMDRAPGSIDLDDAKKAEDEFGLGSLKDDIDDPEEFAMGGRVGFKEGSGYFSNLIKENIPPEYRLYAKSILPGGKKGDVDESYFKEDFKKDLRQQALTKFKETGKLKGSIGELDTHYRSGAKKYGQGEKYPINELIGLPSIYATLGSYNYEIDPQTLEVKIKDTYDWNPAYGKDSFSGKTGWIGNKKGKDVDTSMLKDYVMQSFETGEIDKGDALELLGNYLGPKASRGEGINVDIDIPVQDIPMGEGETFAVGGRVGFKFGTPKKIYDLAKKFLKKKDGLKRQLTDEEIIDFADEFNIDLTEDYYNFDGTLASAQKILKDQQDETAYMYQQYKAGRLDPKSGEQGRKEFLEKKLEEMEMSGDRRLMTPDELEELEQLSKSKELKSGVIDISDPETLDDFANFAKKNDPEGYKKIEDMVNDMNQKRTLDNFDVTDRKKNAEGGLNYLLGF
jgi:hypothetical protein